MGKSVRTSPFCFLSSSTSVCHRSWTNVPPRLDSLSPRATTQLMTEPETKFMPKAIFFLFSFHRCNLGVCMCRGLCFHFCYHFLYRDLHLFLKIPFNPNFKDYSGIIPTAYNFQMIFNSCISHSIFLTSSRKLMIRSYSFDLQHCNFPTSER
mgnify:CR=1 FL=1